MEASDIGKPILSPFLRASDGFIINIQKQLLDGSMYGRCVVKGILKKNMDWLFVNLTNTQTGTINKYPSVPLNS